MNLVHLHETISGSRRSVTAGAMRIMLAALEPPYRLAVFTRNALFDFGLRAPVGLARPVISVGNLTTGGTGKTPMVGLLAQRLAGMGYPPAVLLRGYGAAGGVSDEAAMLADELGSDVPVGVNADRAAGARNVLARHDHIAVFLLDDGFQHRQVRRDLDIVLIDATDPFGFGHVLPRGLLREPRGNLRRADAVIVTRADQVPDGVLSRLDQTIEQLTGQKPCAHAAHQWTGLKDQTDQTQSVAVLGQLKVWAVAGIGNGAAFSRSLQQHAGGIVGERRYPDHHAYTRRDLDTIRAVARQAGAEAVVTTTKDWVKWRLLGWPNDASLPVYRPTVRIDLVDGGETVWRLLEQTMRPAL